MATGLAEIKAVYSLREVLCLMVVQEEKLQSVKIRAFHLLGSSVVATVTVTKMHLKLIKSRSKVKRSSESCGIGC